jgi:uncharacterized membrane protein
MQLMFLSVVVGLTSGLAYCIARLSLGLSFETLCVALRKMLECLGLILIFFVLNLATGVTAIHVARQISRGFVPHYLAGDVTLLVLSLLQALTAQWVAEFSLNSSRGPSP